MSIHRATDREHTSANPKGEGCGVEYVNFALAEMDRLVRNRAPNVEGSSSVARQIAAQSQELAAILAHFGPADDCCASDAWSKIGTMRASEWSASQRG